MFKSFELSLTGHEIVLPDHEIHVFHVATTCVVRVAVGDLGGDGVGVGGHHAAGEQVAHTEGLQLVPGEPCAALLRLEDEPWIARTCKAPRNEPIKEDILPEDYNLALTLQAFSHTAMLGIQGIWPSQLESSPAAGRGQG
jgi:hypothetical protein